MALLHEEDSKKIIYSMLLNLVLKLPQKKQDTIWRALFMALWGDAPDKSRRIPKNEVMGDIFIGSKLAKADSDSAINAAPSEVTALIEVAADGSKLTKVDAGP